MKMTAPMEVGLTVKNLPVMLEFYTKAFGMTVVADVVVPAPKASDAALSAGAYRVIRLQTPWGERIKLLAPEQKPEDMPEATPYILDRHANSYITFIVDDLPKVVDAAKQAGASMMTGEDPVEVRPGTFLAFLHDPEGHILEIVQYADINAYRDDLGDHPAVTGQAVARKDLP